MKTSLRCFTVALTIAALGSSLMLTGCGTKMQEAVRKARGEESVILEKPYDDVVAASKNALKSLEFKNINEKRDALVALISAVTAEERSIELRVSRQTDKITRVQIRVGAMGDDGMQKIILEKIKAQL